MKREPRRVFTCAASSSIREQIHGDSWIFVGDAASTYDPLLGKGVPLALAKGAAIARLVSSGANLRVALRTYAEAERANFADFLSNRMIFIAAQPLALTHRFGAAAGCSLQKM
jgi:flavin-dependent dehydrogenase